MSSKNFSAEKSILDYIVGVKFKSFVKMNIEEGEKSLKVKLKGRQKMENGKTEEPNNASSLKPSDERKIEKLRKMFLMRQV